VLLIHSDTVWLLRLAAAVIAFRSSERNRTGTMRPFASPLASLGRPGFLGFFWGSKFELLHDSGSHCA
jgi:hypothetical protein